MKNDLSYDEVVDTLTDIIKAVTGFRKAFQGSFDLMRFLAWALDAYPNLREVFEDFDTFLAQLKDLTPEEAQEAVEAIRGAVEPDAVNDRVLYVLQGLAGTYGYVEGTYTGARALVDYWKGI